MSVNNKSQSAGSDILATAIGNPKKLAREIEDFRHSAKVLSSSRANLVSKYPKRWVAICKGAVKADAKTLPALLKLIDEKNLPRDQIIVRYIDRNVRKLIL